MKTPEIFPSATNRRGFLKTAGMTGLGLASAAAVATKFNSPQDVQAAGITDVDILNFALNLEYLEAEFYCMAVLGKTLVELGIITAAQQTGPTTGGKMVADLASTHPASYMSVSLRINEVDHVQLLRSALGGAAVPKPAINLDAASYGFYNTREFLALARTFEEVGTSAYLGAAPLITNSSYLATAGSILTVEAKHTGAIRMACINANIVCNKIDSLDYPPNIHFPFDAVPQGLTSARTPTQVLGIVYGGNGPGGFFPAGMNGTIK